jgi:hypothetical protein
MIRRTLLALLAVVGVGAVGVVQPAHATTIMKTTESERIQMADLILRGQVVEMWTERNQQGRIVTRVMVQPGEVFKGEAPDGTIVVTQPGGTLAGQHIGIQGGARFDVGEEVILLLQHKERTDSWVTISMGYGKYTIRLDPYSRREVVQQYFVPAHVDYDHRFLPFPAESQKVFADEFQTRILDTVAGRLPVEVTQ